MNTVPELSQVSLWILCQVQTEYKNGNTACKLLQALEVWASVRVVKEHTGNKRWFILHPCLMTTSC